MSEVFSTLGSLFSNKAFAPAVTGISAGAGEVGNLLAQRQGSQELSFLQNYQKKMAAMTPQQLSSMVLSAQQPLNNGLTQAVGNQVQGDVASRGLAEAPGIFASTESQALAPFYQQNQSNALQQVLAQLQLPLDATAGIKEFQPSSANNIPALMAFLKSIGKTGSNPGAAGNTPTDIPFVPPQTQNTDPGLVFA